MKENIQYKELATRYGFTAPPECVSRLTELVAQSDLDVEKVAKIIASDKDLRARLLRVANPRADDPSEYTIDNIESALMRNGVACAMLIAMGTPLAIALVRTVQTMLSLKLEPVERRAVPTLSGEHLLSTIGFSGKAEGSVYLRMDTETSVRVASAILGVPADALSPGSDVNDAVGELLNIMAGNFKSNLCDAGLVCRLQTPNVRTSEDLETPSTAGGGIERMAFRSGSIVLHVDLTVNPWNIE